MTLIIATKDKGTIVLKEPKRYEIIKKDNGYCIIFENGQTIENIKSIVMNEKRSHVKFGNFRG